MEIKNFALRITITDIFAVFLPGLFCLIMLHALFLDTDFSNSLDKARHDRMVSLVEQMLSLNKQLQTAKTDHEKTSLQRQIEFTDRQIDHLVYELYGLTEDDIKIVEGKV